jgi:hypothetical protein
VIASRELEVRLAVGDLGQERLGHTVEVLARTHAHVIAEYRGQGPIDPEAPISEARGKSKTPQNRPTPDYQQLELPKPTGGLEPPTPSLRVLPMCPWWGSRGINLP